ncbi:MAG TPA: M14 metallopeptidase family protein [Longimicrobiales bacterium]|nr:M14 metallopeptidase family protein [Longimicrobiales bacterium]
MPTAVRSSSRRARLRAPSLRRRTAFLPALLLALALPVAAQVDGPRNAAITTPEAFLGFELGADYHLATYQQLMDYWEVLDQESDRMTLRSIGETQQGRPHFQAIITAPENHANLDRYREISSTLARARVGADQARALAAEGKAVIWIDGGLHATEVLGAQQLMQLVYDMVSLEDPETLRFLDDVVLLATHANPDGHALVANWYMRSDDPMQRSSQGVPELYQEYAGHDNNRDFYMANLDETRNMNRVMYTEWYPQIVYNHHQTGPAGTIMFAPPFRDPMNHYLDPLLKTSLDQVGSAMHQRFVVEGKGGTTMRSGASYSTWWNGGLRTTPYFHNQIGLLTETIGHPNPMTVPFIPSKQISQADLPLPVEPGPWHFKQSVDYSQTANRAVLDYASRNREHLLYNMWLMGANHIERGSTDHWTVLPFEIDAAAEVIDGRGDHDDYERLLEDPADRDPRGFVIPRDQPDFQTARKFVNALLMNGVEVHRATSDFSVAGTGYPAGSFVVRSDQAFRAHVLDMFEPQEHPNDFAYPGAPPTAPYDNAGWTLAFQMGVEFDRILDGFDGPFERIDAFWLDAEPAVVASADDAVGFLVDGRANDAFVLVNRALEEDVQVYRLTAPVSAQGREWPAGAFYFQGGDAGDVLATAARETGVPVVGVNTRPSGEALALRPLRIGLWDQYGGSMPSGWTRYVLDQFEFDYEVVYPPELDEAPLSDRFDVLLFPDGAIPGIEDDGDGFRRGGGDEFAATIPEDLRSRLGSVTAETTVPRILEFVRDGGTVVAVGSSTNLAFHAGLPVSDWLVDDNGEHLPREEYFTPGSVHDVKVEHVSPVTLGIEDRINILHSHSPVFRVEDDSVVKVLAWYDSDHPLRSGWAWGQERLEGGASMLEASLGEGTLYLFGPKVTFRGQAHMTIPLVMNGIITGTAETVRLDGIS